ncbi:Mercuric ion reductase, partial [hydrothermal vent metagenome]
MLNNIFDKKGGTPQNTENISLKIEGMTCSSCSSHIEKDINKIKGILSSSVNHETGVGTFTYEKDKLNKKVIVNTINNIGHYKVVSNISDDKSNNHFDVIIIGGGSAAFSVAIKAESLGLSTLMVNDGLDFGGTCVNVGCVPSKNLIRAAETAYHSTHSNFSGIKPKGVDIDFKQLIKDKKQLVASLQQQKYMDVVSDFESLTMLKGWAEFIDSRTIIVDKKETYTALKFVIATGATTNIPNIEGLNKVNYLTHVSLFDLEEQPKSLTILGAGYIGLEIAQAYNRLGTKVRIIEFTDRPLRSQAKDITDVLETQFKDEGIEILPNYRAFKIEQTGRDTIIHCKCPDGSTTKLIEKNYIVVATGIKPNTSKLGLQNININQTERGHIIVNEKMETNIPNIYSAGDVVNTPSFVYTAASEGDVAITNAFTRENKTINYSSLPWVVFTDPQIAGAGMDELEAEKKGIPFEVSKLDLTNVPRALAA